MGRRPDATQGDRPLRAAGEAVLVRRDVTDDLAERDRHDGEVIGAQTQRRQAEDEAADAGRGDSERGREPHAPALLHDEDRHRVRADRHEGDLAKVEQSREPKLHLKPESEDRVDPGDDPDERPEAAAAEDVHATRAWPKSPCGRRSSAITRTAKATTGLYTGLTPPRETGPRRQFLRNTEQNAARESAVRAADPSEHHCGEHGQEQLEAEVRVERVLDQRCEHAGEAAAEADGQPGDADRAADVDARNGGERPVVRHRANDPTRVVWASNSPTATIVAAAAAIAITCASDRRTLSSTKTLETDSRGTCAAARCRTEAAPA